MSQTAFTCPRCLHAGPLPPGARYCPRCGLVNVQCAGGDEPMDVVAGGRTYRVLGRVTVGTVATVYRCQLPEGPSAGQGVFKIVADASNNDLIANEAAVLRHLRASPDAARFGAFLPGVEQSFGFQDEPGAPPRQANVLRLHPSIASVDELYTLEEVRACFPAGLDPRHMAWIWRRLLTVLGFVHGQGVIHSTVIPPHVLIEPREHKLLLIDWCAATREPRKNPGLLALIGGARLDWYRREGALDHPPTPGLDLALAARCMIELVGGDGMEGTLPGTVDAVLQRYFQRCLQGGSGRRSDTGQLLQDFDRIIEALWGPRQFRVLELPPKIRR